MSAWRAGALVLAIAAGAWDVGRLLAADWPEWRGPGRNGVAERSPPLAPRFSGPRGSWTSEGYPSGEEGGRGSLAVEGGKVYGVTRSSGAPADDVFCLDADTGERKWVSRLRGEAGDEPSSATPCIRGGRVYVPGSTGRLYCLDAAGGAEVWSERLERLDGRTPASSAAVADGAVALLAGVLAAFDAETGRKLWAEESIPGHQSSPAVWETSDGDARFISNTGLETVCVGARSGQVLWRVPGGGLSTPAVAREYGGDFLAVLSDSRRNGLTAYKLEAGGPRKLWTVHAHDRGASPLIHLGHVYAIAGGANGHGARALCVHLDSGAVAWDEAIDFAEVSSPALADGKVFAVCGTALRVIGATPEDYSVLGTQDLRVTLCTSPALAEGRLFLRQANGVVCHDLRAAP